MGPPRPAQSRRRTWPGSVASRLSSRRTKPSTEPKVSTCDPEYAPSPKSRGAQGCRALQMLVRSGTGGGCQSDKPALDEFRVSTWMKSGYTPGRALPAGPLRIRATGLESPTRCSSGGLGRSASEIEKRSLRRRHLWLVLGLRPQARPHSSWFTLGQMRERGEG